MKNRIRLFRRQRGLTLKELAEAVGTTPQTVSRLETEVMTLSTEWLERLAGALNVHPTELLEAPDRPDIPLIGVVGANGTLSRSADVDNFAVDIRAEHPVAVRLAQGCGPYQAGEILIANRFEGEDLENVLGRDCLCCTADGRVLLRRVVRGSDKSYTLVPLQPDGDIRYNQDLRWAARVVLRLQYL
jgi:transcriptional regulator with XRE-family HTH domain